MTDWEFNSRTHISDGNECEMLGVCEFVCVHVIRFVCRVILNVPWSTLHTTFFRLAFLTLWQLRCNVRIDTLIFGLQFYWPNCDIAWLDARKNCNYCKMTTEILHTHTHTRMIVREWSIIYIYIRKQLIRIRKPPIKLYIYDGGWHNSRGVINHSSCFSFLPCLK